MSDYKAKKATVIAMTNQKGGVGKTTTTLNLGVGLAMRGKQVLLIDADSQGNLTMALGVNTPDDLENTISSVMRHVIEAVDRRLDYSADVDQDAILKHPEGVDFVPANIELAGMEVQLNARMDRERILGEFIRTQRDKYDYIIIDCMPSLGLATLNALSAADKVIIPTQAHYLSAKGIEQLMRNVGNVQRYINPKLEVSGILLTMVERNTKISRELADMIDELYGSHVKVFDNRIGKSIKAVEASYNGESIYAHANRSTIAEQYAGFVDEVIRMMEPETVRTAAVQNKANVRKNNGISL